MACFKEWMMMQSKVTFAERMLKSFSDLKIRKLKKTASGRLKKT